MKSLILTTFLIHLVLSDSIEDKYNFEELCSKSYFDRLVTTDRYYKPLDGKQVFHLYRSDPFNPGFVHYWKMTVERSGIDKTLKAIPNEYLLDLKDLPEYQMILNYTIGISTAKDSSEILNEYQMTLNHTNNYTVIKDSIKITKEKFTPNEWYSAVGFNALDNNTYALIENKTIFDMKIADRSHYVCRIGLNYHWSECTVCKEKGITFVNVTLKEDKQFGKIPILEFLGIDCPKEEEPLISDEVRFYIFGILLFFAIVLPITDLWLIANRNRITQEIYDDSRLGSISATASATHSSEIGSVKLSPQRRIIDRRGAK